jgi:hypothetical protein
MHDYSNDELDELRRKLKDIRDMIATTLNNDPKSTNNYRRLLKAIFKSANIG